MELLKRSLGLSARFWLLLGVGLAAVALLLAGCGRGGRERAQIPARDPYYGDFVPPSLPPLRGEGFPFGRPPDAQVTVGGARAQALLASWNWPKSPNEVLMDHVSWPPKLAQAVTARNGDLIDFRVPGVTFGPVAVEVFVNPRSYYSGTSWPTKPAQRAVEDTVDLKKDVRVSPEGVRIQWKIHDVPAGDWVVVIHPRWDAPIGGDGVYLLPVRIK